MDGRASLSLPKLLNELKEKIEADYRDNVDRSKTEMLDYWLKNIVGSYKEIVASLYSIDYNRLAEKLQKDYDIAASSLDQSWTSTDSEEVMDKKYMIQQEEFKIREKYGLFMVQLQELLQKKRVQVDKIKLFLNCLLDNDKAHTPEMRQAKDIPSFMQSFSRTHAWWNIRISSSIASHFCGDKGIKLVEGYETQLRGHLSNQIQKLPVVGSPKKLVVKINRDHNSYSEENIDEFRRSISTLLKQRPSKFVFLSAEEGCIRLTFLMSSIYVDRINDILGHLEEHGVTYLSINGVTLWSSGSHNKQDNQMDQQQTKRIKALEDLQNIPPKRNFKKSRTLYRGGKSGFEVITSVF